MAASQASGGEDRRGFYPCSIPAEIVRLFNLLNEINNLVADGLNVTPGNAAQRDVPTTEAP